MAKLQRETRPPAEAAPTPAPEAAFAVKLTHPLFGVVKGANPEKWLAVSYQGGEAKVLTPKRGGKDLGEAHHHAIARAVDAFRASVLGRRS